MFENTPELVNIIILATVAGFFSSIAGGVIAILTGKPNKKFIGLSFAFAAAVLLALVFVDFVPHAIGHGHYHITVNPDTGVFYEYWYQHSGAGIWLTIAALGFGAGLIMLLRRFDKHGHEHIHGILPHSEHCSHDEKNGLSAAEKRRVAAIAFPVAAAIILHDLPKGLAIGSVGSIAAAVAIGLSCIPEGMTIAIPLKAGGKKPWKILAVCGIAGLATVLGAVIGYLIGGISTYLSGVMIALAAGCILAVVLSEILPLAFEYSKGSKLKFPIMVAGILIVIAFNHFFHGLMH